MTPPREAEVAALLEKATPGPWQVVDRIWLPRDGNTYVIAGHYDPHVGRFVCDVGQVEEWDEENTRESQFDQKEADAALIVALRNEAPALLEELAALRARVAELEREREEAGRTAAEFLKNSELLLAQRDSARAERDALRAALRGHEISKHGTPSLDAAVRFVDEHVAPRKCDSDGVSHCWRCQTVFLASIARRISAALAAAPKEGGTR